MVLQIKYLDLSEFTPAKMSLWLKHCLKLIIVLHAQVINKKVAECTYLTTIMIPSVASTVNINNKYLLHEYCKSHKRQEITLRKFINNCSLLVHFPSPTRLTIEILSILIKLM